jgi:uncharacterized membrane protein YfcA
LNLLIILIGLIVGFMIGLTGMGGGALMTPFMLIVLKMDPVIAIGTDLTFAAITKVVGGLKHRREENVNFTAVGWMAAGSLPASFFGAQIVLRLGRQDFIINGLPKILGATLALVALLIALRAAGLIKAKDDRAPKLPSPVGLAGIGVIGGFLVGMTSIGGGTVIMALLMLFYAIPLNYLVGLDVVHGALLAGVSAFSYNLAGKVDWSIVIWLLLGSLPGVWMGARAVARVNRSLVRFSLAAFIFLAGLRLLFGG